MKTVLSLLCFFAIFGLILSLQNEEEIMKECQTKLKATDADMKVFKDLTELPKTKEQYCLAACYYKKAKMMDDNNKLIYDKIEESLKPLMKDNKEMYDKLTKIIKKCTDTVTPDKDECESSKKYIDCVVNNSKDGSA